jgi:hypothetical protein
MMGHRMILQSQTEIKLRQIGVSGSKGDLFGGYCVGLKKFREVLKIGLTNARTSEAV